MGLRSNWMTYANIASMNDQLIVARRQVKKFLAIKFVNSGASVLLYVEHE